MITQHQYAFLTGSVSNIFPLGVIRLGGYIHGTVRLRLGAEYVLDSLLIVPKVVKLIPLATFPQAYLFHGPTLLLMARFPVGNLAFLIKIIIH